MELLKLHFSRNFRIFLLNVVWSLADLSLLFKQFFSKLLYTPSISHFIRIWYYCLLGFSFHFWLYSELGICNNRLYVLKYFFGHTHLLKIFNWVFKEKWLFTIILHFTHLSIVKCLVVYIISIQLLILINLYNHPHWRLQKHLRAFKKWRDGLGLWQIKLTTCTTEEIDVKYPRIYQCSVVRLYITSFTMLTATPSLENSYAFCAHLCRTLISICLCCAFMAIEWDYYWNHANTLST